jgi:hypothetical protein
MVSVAYVSKDSCLILDVIIADFLRLLRFGRSDLSQMSGSKSIRDENARHVRDLSLVKFH